MSAERAAQARSNLNIFAAIVAILEGGTITIESDSASRNIIRICLAEQQKCLRRYEREIAKLSKKETPHVE